MFVLVGHSYLS